MGFFENFLSLVTQQGMGIQLWRELGVGKDGEEAEWPAHLSDTVAGHWLRDNLYLSGRGSGCNNIAEKTKRATRHSRSKSGALPPGSGNQLNLLITGIHHINAFIPQLRNVYRPDNAFIPQLSNVYRPDNAIMPQLSNVYRPDNAFIPQLSNVTYIMPSINRLWNLL